MAPPTSWSTENVCREAWLALATRPLRTLLTVVVVAILLGTVFGVEARATNDALAESRRLDAAGQHVFRARPTQAVSEPVLNRATCDGLVRLSQIELAGGLTDLGSMDFPSAPETPLRVFEATGSFAAIVDESLKGPSSAALISTRAVRILGAASTTIELPGGRTVAFKPFDPKGRHPSSELMILLPTSEDLVQECWFLARPGSSATTANAVSLLLTTDAGPAAVGAILEPSATSVDPLRNYRDRSTRLLWVLSGLVGGLLLASLTIRDREQIALSRVLGATYLQAVGIGVVQLVLLVLWTLPAAVVGAGLLMAIEVNSDGFGSGLVSAAAAAATMSSIGVTTRYVVARESVSQRLRHGRE